MISPNDQSSLPEQCQLANRPVCLYKRSSDHISPDCFRNRTMSANWVFHNCKYLEAPREPKRLRSWSPHPCRSSESVSAEGFFGRSPHRKCNWLTVRWAASSSLSAINPMCCACEWSNAVALNTAPKAPPQLRGSGMSGKVALSPAREDSCRRNEVFCPASHAAVF